MYYSKSITLASESPRRRDILTQLGIQHTVHPSCIDEHSDISDPRERVCELALQKAQEVREKVDTDLVIASDTVVALPLDTHTPHPEQKSVFEIFEKPENVQVAHAMLLALSGKIHKVFSSICIIDSSSVVQVDADCTTVHFIDIKAHELEYYLESNEWQGVAGGYRIQGKGAFFIASIEGNYSTVMGLSIPLLRTMLTEHHSAL